jgi:hypothetical protein
MRHWLIMVALAVSGTAYAQGKAQAAAADKKPAQQAPSPAPAPAAAVLPSAPPPTLAALKQRADIGADVWQLGARPEAAQLAARQKALPHRERYSTRLILNAKSKKPTTLEMAGIHEIIPLGDGFVMIRPHSSGTGQESTAANQGNGPGEESTAANLMWLGMVPVLTDVTFSGRVPSTGTSVLRKRHTVTLRIIASTLDPAKLAPGYAYTVELEESNEFLATQQDKNEKTPRSRTSNNTLKLKHDCKVIERAPADALQPKFKGSALRIECAIIEPRETVKDKMYFLEDYGFAIWESMFAGSEDTKGSRLERTVELMPD